MDSNLLQHAGAVNLAAPLLYLATFQTHVASFLSKKKKKLAARGVDLMHCQENGTRDMKAVARDFENKDAQSSFKTEN